jgi:hypothetical protein
MSWYLSSKSLNLSFSSTFFKRCPFYPLIIISGNSFYLNELSTSCTSSNSIRFAMYFKVFFSIWFVSSYDLFWESTMSWDRNLDTWFVTYLCNLCKTCSSPRIVTWEEFVIFIPPWFKGGRRFLEADVTMKAFIFGNLEGELLSLVLFK